MPACKPGERTGSGLLLGCAIIEANITAGNVAAVAQPQVLGGLHHGGRVFCKCALVELGKGAGIDTWQLHS
jgi:hypothetical protein